MLTSAAHWVLRLGWIAVGAGGWALFDDVDPTGARRVAVAVLLVIGWLAGVASVAVPAVVTLTAARVVLPLAVPAVVALVIAADDPDAVTAGATVAAAVLVSVVVALPELGRSYVQASAYGREDRHLLRAPPAYLLAAVVAWVLTATGLVAGTILLGRGAWWAGGVSVAVAIVVGVFAWPRWHRLSRRWLVLVPSGLVVHDHLVLAETLMIPTRDVAGLLLAEVGTEAADLTGPAGGHALEIRTATDVTAIRAATPSQPQGSAIHLRACLIAPTRPGRALRSAGDRRLPVG